MARKDKTADRIWSLFQRAESGHRKQWEFINQKGADFANDNQLSHAEKTALEEQGMPTFTINRITPVVEMLNFYATANNPRWQAVGVEGSDTDVAAVFSDIADYIWHESDGSSLLSNAINDAVTKSIGWMLLTVDPDRDRGLGEVIIEQPDPFDIFVDEKSRDILFRDASFIMVRKVLPKAHLKQKFPDAVRKISNASARYGHDRNYSEKTYDENQSDFSYKDIISGNAGAGLDGASFSGVDSAGNTVTAGTTLKGSIAEDTEGNTLMEYFEVYEKVKLPYMNVFYRIPPSKQELESIQQQVQVYIQEMQQEMQVAFLEKQTEMQKAVEAVKFYDDRVKQTIVVGDKTISEVFLPDKVKDYPLVPFHYKWTGTPYPISAVSPLVGKQQEMNKAHQLMVHNAALGSSLRWMHEEGAIDKDYWEKYSSAPGALLPIRPGAMAPTPIQPAPLNNAFFGIVNEGKQDMEYLAGIYSSMQGDTGGQHDTYRGMLAMDEYGTRRIKYWLNNCIEPALRQMGKIVAQFSQAVYTAHKVFRIVQPNNQMKEVEINQPMYNDMGQGIGKFLDYEVAQFDVQMVSGSTMPVNRWAYLEELKQLMQLGVVDDVAVLAETDIRNKDKIMQRKSLIGQLQGQIESLQEGMSDKDGAIETLERQLIQAGIKSKVLQGAMEVNKKVNDTKGRIEKSYLKTENEQEKVRNLAKTKMESASEELKRHVADLTNNNKPS